MSLEGSEQAHPVDRSAISFAFEASNGGSDKDYINKLGDAARKSLVQKWQGAVTPEQSRILRENTEIVIPGYNEGKAINTVLNYVVEQHGIPPNRVTVLDCSDDPEDQTAAVAGSYGVETFRQEDILRDLVNHDAFLDLLQATKIPRGKGTTLLCAWLHLLSTGKVSSSSPDSLHVTCLDSDPQDYSKNKYDPLTQFAELRLHHGAESMKPAKTRRNNQPVYVAHNSIAALGRYGRESLEYVGKMQWSLSGEMSRKASITDKLVMGTGYPVETLMNMSDDELGLHFMQFADGPERSDGANDYEKETIMYTQIGRTRLAIQRWCDANLLARQARTPEEIIALQESSTYKKAIDFDAHDVREVNAILAMQRPTFVPDETNRVPEKIRVVDVVESRLIGTVRALKEAGIVKL